MRGLAPVQSLSVGYNTFSYSLSLTSMDIGYSFVEVQWCGSQDTQPTLAKSQ